ncbi:uncharacterized protein TNCV_2013991 [Trichonephila clavipes]|nr:uncharacterized protein TNCV_2013991 [Trichonephila clavipes]
MFLNSTFDYSKNLKYPPILLETSFLKWHSFSVRNSGKEVKLFTSALKAFQCNNRIVMAQRKHLDDFLRGRIIGRLECNVPSCKYPRNLESLGVSSPGFGNDSKMIVM